MSLTQAPSTDLDHAQLAAILRWYVDMGVDIAIEEEAQNRFVDVARPAAVVAPQEAAPANIAAYATALGATFDAAAVRTLLDAFNSVKD